VEPVSVMLLLLVVVLLEAVVFDMGTADVNTIAGDAKRDIVSRNVSEIFR